MKSGERSSAPGASGMRRGCARRPAVGIAIVWVLILGLPSGVGAAQPAPVESEVRAMLDDYVAATNALDWDEVATYYADDPRFRWIEDGVVRYASHAELSETLENLDRMFSSVVMRLSDTVVLPLGTDAAQVSSVFSQEIVLPDGSPLTLEGAITMVVVRTGEGWKFLAGHTSSARNVPDL